MKKYFSGTKRLAVCFYAATLLVWLGFGLLFFLTDDLFNVAELQISDAEPVFLLPQADDGFLSESTDPQLIFTLKAPRYVRVLRLYATFAIDPGEMELFYYRKIDGAFSAKQRVIGRPMADGSYIYTLPMGTVQALRIDPGTAGGNVIHIESVQINPNLPAGYYFLPSLRQGLGLVFWPALALCAFTLARDFLAKYSQR